MSKPVPLDGAAARPTRRPGARAAAALVMLALASLPWPLPDPGAGGFDPARLQAVAARLASTRFEGRGPGSAGLTRAGALLARRLAACGVAPGGPDGSYFQPFTVRAPARLEPASALAVVAGGGRRVLAVGADWMPLAFSANGEVAGPLVWAPRGLAALPDDTPLAGRIVLVREGGGHEGADLRLLATAARERGAAALVALITADEQPLRLADAWNVTDAGIPAVRLRWSALAEHLDADARAAVEAADRTGPPARPLPGPTLALRVDLSRETATLRNVVGLVPGRSARGTVVLGAHYDHLGRGGAGSLAAREDAGAIHPGADDNASGVAVALAVACRLAAAPAARSLVVAFFGGEELGLLGSAHYVRHPVVPLAETVAMLNLDMVGRLRRERIVVFGTATAEEFPTLVRTLGLRSGLRLVPNPDGLGPSDHTSFAAEGRPVLHFFTGVHTDYHRPSDRAEHLNAAGMATVADLVLATIEELDAGDPPTFVAAAPPARATSGTGYGAYLGTVPDFGQTSRGVRLAAVRDGSPAAAAGLRAGDVIVRLGTVAVGDLYDLTYALRARKPGDRVAIEVRRGGRRKTVETTLGSRS